MEDNGIKGLSNLGPLPRLRALYLSLNRIVELSELEKLRSLRHLLVIHMAQNPVARKPQYRLQLLHCVPSARAVDGREAFTLSFCRKGVAGDHGGARALGADRAGAPRRERREALREWRFCDNGKTAAGASDFLCQSGSQVYVFNDPPPSSVQVWGLLQLLKEASLAFTALF